MISHDVRESPMFPTIDEEQRAAARRAAQAAAPVFEQIRRQLEHMARTLTPIMEQLAQNLAKLKTHQEDFVLAPPPAGGRPAKRRRGRAAQFSPYGPQRRR